MTDYYDYVLGLIPLSIAVLTGVFLAAGFQLTTAVSVGSVVAAGLVGHAMFVNAPVSAARGTTDSADAHNGTNDAAYSAD